VYKSREQADKVMADALAASYREAKAKVHAAQAASQREAEKKAKKSREQNEAKELADALAASKREAKEKAQAALQKAEKKKSKKNMTTREQQEAKELAMALAASHREAEGKRQDAVNMEARELAAARNKTGGAKERQLQQVLLQEKEIEKRAKEIEERTSLSNQWEQAREEAHRRAASKSSKSGASGDGARIIASSSSVSSTSLSTSASTSQPAFVGWGSFAVMEEEGQRGANIDREPSRAQVYLAAELSIEAQLGTINDDQLSQLVIQVQGEQLRRQRLEIAQEMRAEAAKVEERHGRAQQLKEEAQRERELGLQEKSVQLQVCWLPCASILA
jgi:hypothetical protein